MHAQLLSNPQSVDSAPLHLAEIAEPAPQANFIRLKVRACGVCHTDLHICEGEIHPSKMPIVPGHQIVGTVEARGNNAKRFELGARVGVPWLNWIDPSCKWFGTDRENLCENIRFTGFDVDGGYADFVVVDENFAYPVPEAFTDTQIAPLLCAGVIGYRALRLSDIERGERIGLFGFGASATMVLQVARYWNKEVYVFTRAAKHQEYAKNLGAAWVGDAKDTPPHKLDSAINFTPLGEIMVRALELSEWGATVVHAGIHSTPIPSFDYELLYHERTLRSAANSTRRDVIELLDLAPKIPIQSEVTTYSLQDTNRALQDVKHSRLNGAAVVVME
jgi:propanol-preferring alcohol dehydrogenase